MASKLTSFAFLPLLGLLLPSCFARTNIIALGADFTPSEVDWSRGKGTNTLEGSALLRQRGGGVVTCAGFPVRLVPVSEYAEKRMQALYGSASGGFAPLRDNRPITFIPDPPEYYATAREAVCDAQGRFRFKALPDGSYFVTTQVSWEVPIGYGATSKEGGFLTRRVDLSNGTEAEVVLTQ